MRINEAEDWISELEYTVVEITAMQENKGMKTNEDSSRLPR